MIYLAAFILLFVFGDAPVPLCESDPTPPAGLYVDLPKTKNVFDIPAVKTIKQIRYEAQCKDYLSGE